MKKEVRIRIRADGSIDCIYDDELVALLGARAEKVCRASNVEWEKRDDVVYGWTVRSAKDCELAIRLDEFGRYCASRRGMLVYFAKREFALAEEMKLFWQLFEPIRLEMEWAEKGWETNPCPKHGVTGCMWCRYGEGLEPRRKGEPRDLECPVCHAMFADPDPNKEYPHGILCPECRKNNEGGIVGVIHPT